MFKLTELILIPFVKVVNSLTRVDILLVFCEIFVVLVATFVFNVVILFKLSVI